MHHVLQFPVITNQGRVTVVSDRLVHSMAVNDDAVK